jgi:hypothetical protein
MREGSRLVVQKPVHAFGGEAFLPAPDAGLRLAGLTHDRVRAGSLGAEQNDLRPPHVLLRRVSVFDRIAKPIKVGGRKENEMPVRMPQTRTPRVRRES